MLQNNFKKVFVCLVTVFFALGFIGTAYAEKAKFVWKTCTPTSKEESAYKAQVEFADLIKKRTNGKIEIKVYSNSALGPMYDEFENVVRGTQEMGFLIPSPHYNKALQVVFMPYLVTNWDEGDSIYKQDGWLFNVLKPLYGDIGIELLGFSYLGMGGYGSTKGPIVTPSDIKKLGIKTRVWCTADRLLFQELGGTVSMPFADLYTALQTGLCHAQDNAPAATYQQLRDVTKYYTTINWDFEVFSVIMNKAIFDKLSPELQGQVRNTMEEVLAKYNNIAKNEQDEYLKKMTEFGIEVIKLNDQQLKPWVKHGRSVWKKMEEECGKEIIDIVKSKIKNR